MVVTAAICQPIRPDIPELLMERGPLIKPRWVQSGQWHRASCNPGTTGDTETKYVAEQHPTETSKMPRGISEWQGFLQGPLH